MNTRSLQLVECQATQIFTASTQRTKEYLSLFFVSRKTCSLGSNKREMHQWSLHIFLWERHFVTCTVLCNLTFPLRILPQLIPRIHLYGEAIILRVFIPFQRHSIMVKFLLFNFVFIGRVYNSYLIALNNTHKFIT